MPGYISTADGNSVYVWGYADADTSPVTMQYPGPSLIVNQGDVVTVNLHNDLPVPVSMIFPGQSDVVASSGVPGVITLEAAVAGDVSYSFVASEPGTYMYHSATQQALQIEMGLVGTLIVRPAAGPTVADPLHQAYGHDKTIFTHEYLFLLSEMDQNVHALLESQILAGSPLSVDMNTRSSNLWFINGRNGPDTLLENNVSWLPNQPYNIVPRMHPGEKLLMRVVNVGQELHPFHTHGNNTLTIARDGRMLESAPGAGPDLATSNYTIQAIPGETYDSIFEWTGKGLNWDIYGHDASSGPCTTPDDPGNPCEPFESAEDHGKPFPQVNPGVALTLPNVLDRTDGQFYSGSPFLGKSEAPRPGQISSNQFGGYFHMWHSHAEKELTNDNIFPGGMMTLVIIEPHSVAIP
jgi:FtsP/CotA-like multicopper oxidase with cupredoxin domain